MTSRWTFFLSALWVALIAPPLLGQSLLEQLEKKVRDGLELSAPQTPAEKSPAPGPAPASPGTSDAELPAPIKKTPPPPPTPSLNEPGAPRASTSILETPSTSLPLPPSQPGGDLSESGSRIYLGLEAESLIGGGIGVRVAKVTENSPAWRSGFRVNDEIRAIDGYAITDLDAMVERLALRRPGDTIKVLLLRDGRNTELTAVLQDAAIAQRVQGADASALPPAQFVPGQAWMGVVVADLSSAFRNQFGLRVYRAAAVTNVTKGSPADLVNIQPGDAIVAVDSRSIESSRELLDWMLQRRPGERVSLTVMRGTRTSTVEVTLATDPKFAPPSPPRRAPLDVVSTPPEPAEVVIDAGENTIPPPPEGEPVASVQQLREELRATRQQLTSLEQRIAELEIRLNKSNNAQR